MGLEPSPVVDSRVGIDEPAAGEKPWLLWSAFYTQVCCTS